MKIRNPRTGEFDYELHADGVKGVQSKVHSLRENQRKWLESGLDYRMQAMQQWLDHLQHFQQEIQTQLSIDTGRTKIAALEVNGIIGLLRAWLFRSPQIMQEIPLRASHSQASVQVGQQWVPYSLVGVISPWNFPLLLGLIDSIPALLAGSAVLLKPSEVTPRFIDPLEKSIQAVPELAAVFQLARGGAETGKAMVQAVDVVCFTGSVPTGRSIAKACAERFIPAFLELGGKDPAVVLKDADLEIASDAILRSCVGASGQACQSLERIYVDQAIFQDFVARIVAKAEKLKLSLKPKQGQLGPIIFEQQAAKIQSHLDEAIQMGAKVWTGGKVEQINGGYWCLPTVLTAVNHAMKVMKEETFGPVIPIMPFATETEAIQLANDSIYGLSASVFSSDPDHALAVAQQINAGAISINDGGLTNKVFDAEKNAFGQSGIYGSRMGDAGLMRFFRKKALLIQTEKPATMAGFDEGI